MVRESGTLHRRFHHMPHSEWYDTGTTSCSSRGRLNRIPTKAFSILNQNHDDYPQLKYSSSREQLCIDLQNVL